MPTGLDIEREQNINGSMATYAEQILISTGRNDWKSKIDDEEEGVLLRQLKKFIGPKGKYSDPYHNVMITNSSFAPTPSPRKSAEETKPPETIPHASAFLLPSFQYIPIIPTSEVAVEDFVKAFVLPTKLHKANAILSPTQQKLLLRDPERQSHFPGVRAINEILILICGHGGRDDRCGKLGPILQAEFQDKLRQHRISLHQIAESDMSIETDLPTARVALISHIGGHKWAGNVIIYIPPSFTGNPLAGKGIWYGRVQPEHVEGIVTQTVLGGHVIKDMFRGGIDQGGGIMRL